MCGLLTRQHPLILPQEADIGLWETTCINWEEEVNNINTSLMPLLLYAAPSRSGFKHTLSCSNLRGSSLTWGDLRCSFAPAHRYQMISSSTSNLLTLIPHSQSTSTPPHSCFLPCCHSSTFCFLSPPPRPPPPPLLSITASSQVCVGEFLRWGSRRRWEQSHPTEGCVRMCVQCDIYPDQKKTKRSLV